MKETKKRWFNEHGWTWNSTRMETFRDFQQMLFDDTKIDSNFFIGRISGSYLWFKLELFMMLFMRGWIFWMRRARKYWLISWFCSISNRIRWKFGEILMFVNIFEHFNFTYRWILLFFAIFGRFQVVIVPFATSGTNEPTPNHQIKRFKSFQRHLKRFFLHKSTKFRFFNHFSLSDDIFLLFCHFPDEIIQSFLVLNFCSN